MAEGTQALGLGSSRNESKIRATHCNSMCHRSSTSGERSIGLENLNELPIKVKLEMSPLKQFNARA